MERVFFLLPDFSWEVRWCRVLRQVFGQEHGTWWLVEMYPPIKGYAADASIIMGFNPGFSPDDVAKTTVGVVVAASPYPLQGDRFDPAIFQCLGGGGLVPLNQVSPRAFPYERDPETGQFRRLPGPVQERPE